MAEPAPAAAQTAPTPAPAASRSQAAAQAAMKPAKKPAIRMWDVEVVEVAQETHDTVTLYLAKVEDDGEPWEYKAGQFCTVRPHEFPALAQMVTYFEEVKGKREPARAYSLATAPHEPYVGITIKEEHYEPGETKYPPLLSPFLVYSTPVGERFQIQGFGGPYVWPDDLEDRTDQVVHLVSGSGSVPNFGLVKDALHRGLQVRHTWIYGNKTWDDVIFRDALAEIARRHPDRLEILHCITREDDPTVHGPTCRKGRVSRAHLEELVPDLSRAEFYVCGAGITKWDRLRAKERGTEPAPRFLESTLAILEELGVEPDRIHKESW
ncbi:MAG TPA: oxidoreductase [Thermoanaerobaculia bacterium]|nr:oxidoreductase [Thermoanaerobaculia bacterium]